MTFDVGGIPFSGRPSAQMLAFTPQKLSQKQLDLVESRYQKADFVRAEPNDNSPGEQLPQLVASVPVVEIHPGMLDFMGWKSEASGFEYTGWTREDTRTNKDGSIQLGELKECRSTKFYPN